MGRQVDLGVLLMDRQLVDRDGRRCGKVDDVELEGGPGRETVATGLISGPRTWRAGKHGPIGWLFARLLGGDDTVRVPLGDVSAAEAHVELSRGAAELGLARGEERVAELIRRLPGAR